MVCSSSLQPQANPNNSYAQVHIEVFAFQSCVHGWRVVTLRVCMGVCLLLCAHVGMSYTTILPTITLPLPPSHHRHQLSHCHQHLSTIA